MKSQSQIKEDAKKAARKVIKRAGKTGSQALHVLEETPELIQLQRTDRALRSEMDDHKRTIGNRVHSLHRRARGESPFVGFKTIMKELEALARVEEEYRLNRVHLNQLKERVRGKARK